MKRKISKDDIIYYYDKIGENLTVLSFHRNSKKLIKISRNLNIFEAFREFTLRNTSKTFSVVTKNLPNNFYKYKDVKNYAININDIHFGKKLPKNNSY